MFFVTEKFITYKAKGRSLDLYMLEKMNYWPRDICRLGMGQMRPWIV
jgi:hypothetical protein